MDYESLFTSLSENHVRYILCGGLAMNIYGIPRMTADIDFLVDFEKSNLESFSNSLQKLSYHSTVPVSIVGLSDEKFRNNLLKEKNMIVYSFFNSRSGSMSLDVLLDTPISFNKLWERKEVRKLSGFDVNLISVDDLIALKKYANRTQDKEDIILLSKFKENQ